MKYLLILFSLVFACACYPTLETIPRYGFINTGGEMVIDPTFELCGNFYDGMAWVIASEKRGYIDKSGKMLITPQFEIVGDFHEGLAWVVQFGKGGFIDMKGQFVFEPNFVFASSLYGASIRSKILLYFDFKLGLLFMNAINSFSKSIFF